MNKTVVWFAAIAACGAPLTFAQGGGGRGGRGGPGAAVEEGIPVTSELVISKCGACHTKDEKGNLSRISWERSTPEGWEEAIKRMVRLNGLNLTPAEAKPILKYLSTYHGLSPEEAKPVMYMAEHRIQDEVIPNENVRSTCMNCHALGKPFSWRRSKEDWRLLTNMHTAFFPQAEAAFRRNGGGGGGGGGEGGGAGAGAGGGRGGRGAAAAAAATATTTATATPPAAAPPAAAPPAQPGIPGTTPAASPAAGGGGGGAGGGGGPSPLDEAINFLGTSYPLHTPEWSAWRARMRTPRIAGRWLVSASIPGRGKYYGEMTIDRGAADDEFTTNVKLQSLKGGPPLNHTGTGLVYAGYSWRGRSKGSNMPANAPPDDLAHEMREVMWIAPDQLTAEGRWFWGEYQEFGADVKMERASDGPMVTGTDVTMLKTGATGVAVKLVGDRLPADIAAADLDLGTGVTVKRIASHNATSVVAEVDVAADAVAGKRDVVYKRSVLAGAIAIYDKVDYIKVTPQSTLARLGSPTHPKGFQQFEAIAYQRGADGKPYTADDVELGTIDVSWTVEEFYAVYGDDDKEFVGSLGPTGFFTPAADGPNPQRKFSRNNYGDIWVVATAKNEKDKEGKPLVGRSYLVVTVPMYIRWDQPEVGQ